MFQRKEGKNKVSRFILLTIKTFKTKIKRQQYVLKNKENVDDLFSFIFNSFVFVKTDVGERSQEYR